MQSRSQVPSGLLVSSKIFVCNWTGWSNTPLNVTDFKCLNVFQCLIRSVFQSYSQSSQEGLQIHCTLDDLPNRELLFILTLGSLVRSLLFSFQSLFRNFLRSHPTLVGFGRNVPRHILGKPRVGQVMFLIRLYRGFIVLGTLPNFPNAVSYKMISMTAFLQKG